MIDLDIWTDRQHQPSQQPWWDPRDPGINDDSLLEYLAPTVNKSLKVTYLPRKNTSMKKRTLFLPILPIPSSRIAPKVAIAFPLPCTRRYQNATTNEPLRLETLYHEYII